MHINDNRNRTPARVQEIYRELRSECCGWSRSARWAEAWRRFGAERGRETGEQIIARAVAESER